MSVQLWSVRFIPAANEDKYQIERGEASVFRSAIAELFHGPHPQGAKEKDSIPGAWEYTQHGYKITYIVLETERTMRVIHFERVITS